MTNPTSKTSKQEEVVMRFQHDCDKCKPLGTMGRFDLYYCNQVGMSTVIARFGDDGPEYMSGMNSGNMVLKIAQAMAIEHGYISTSK